MSRRRIETTEEYLARVTAKWDRIYAQPHSVYRAFDSYGLLLYVGCSLNVERRLAAHRSGSPWFRYAESIGIFGPWDRQEALSRERDGIESEAPYFACSVEDMKRTQANLRAAQRAMVQRGDSAPDFDLERHDREGDAYADRHSSLHGAWRRRYERMRESLKATSHPYMTDADRMARYLAAREDAELARQETAA